MMRLRPLLKRFTRKKKKHEDEIQSAGKKKKFKVSLHFLTKFKRIKDKKADYNVEDDHNLRESAVDLNTTEDEPGYITVHVNAENNELVDVDKTAEEIETGDKTEAVERIEPRESVASALCSKVPGEPKTSSLLRVPDPTTDTDKGVQRRSLDQLISDRLSGTSRESPVWARKQLSYKRRTASNISVYSKQPHDQLETRTVWTQTEISESVKIETVEKMVGPSPAGSLDVKLEEIGVGPSPCGSTDFGVESVFPLVQVENPKLAKIKNRIMNLLNYPSLETCEANICVELLRFPKLPFLIALNRKLSEENALFNVEFLELNGLDYLLALMEYIGEEGLADMCDVVMMLEVSECATSVVNSKAGKDYLIAHGEHIVSMARGRFQFLPFRFGSE